MAPGGDEFSFPTVATAEAPPCSVDSPPLWRQTTEAAAFRNENPKETGIHYVHRKSFAYSSDQNGVKSSNDDANDHDEDEKMDLLWEDFNEELSRKGSMVSDNSNMSPGRVMGMGCLQARKMSNGLMLSSRRKGLVVFMKVLTKMVLLRNIHRPTKKL